MKNPHVTAAAAAFALSSLISCPAQATEPTPDGAELFRVNCASCHGVDGRGEGPLAGQLALSVPDLTTYAARADGGFPYIEAVAIIEGDALVRGHGTAMPVLQTLATGPAALLETPDGTIHTSRPVAALVAYLADLQR